jgi:hypothetical protein
MLRAVLLDVGGTIWPNDLAVFAGPDGAALGVAQVNEVLS